MNPTIEWLRKNGVAVTRRNVLNLWFMGDVPEELDPETESELDDVMEQANEENV
jgi:hypothetical protein